MSTTYQLSTADIARREYRIPDVPAARPLHWLRLGLGDLLAAPLTSLTYGAFFALVGILLTFVLDAMGLFFLVPFLAAGFMILAPVLAVGLYSVAKLRAEGRPHDTAAVAGILSRNLPSIGLMGVILLLVFLNWIMLSNLLMGGVFHEILPTWDAVRPLPVLMLESPAALMVFAGMAVILAALVFRMTATALPMLVDDEVDVFNAISASWKAVGENPAAMTLWALCIGVLLLLGFLTLFLGLIPILPWLAYASWHAYRDVLVPAGSAPGSQAGAAGA